MSVLPKSAAGFTDPKYWKNFFAKQKSPFEWYGSYETLSEILEKYIKTSDKFLQLGCGNSELASQLYDNGFRSIYSIDVEPSVIADQKRKNKERKELEFEEGDATKLSCEDGSYTVVLDKGTLDALLPPGATEQEEELVRNMFEEVHRVLQSGGRYIIITLAQPHIIDFWVGHFFPKNQYILRTHKVENKASGFAMPVFVLIATKMRAAMPIALPLEAWRANASKVQRVANVEELKKSIIADQEIAQFIHFCSNKLMNEVSIDFYSENRAGGPRYRICVLDNPECTKFKTFAAFIVPNGRDSEFIFASPKGRQSLRGQCNHDRLVVVFLNRQQHYDSLDVVKTEMGHFISLLDIRPHEQNSVFDILSVGGIDVKKTIASGKSAINGDWSVEEVQVDEILSRRLVFLNTMNLVQSEANIKIGKKNKRIIDLEDLSCEFHIMMIGSLALSPLQPLFLKEVPIKMAVLGLGGGLLATYLLRNFKKSKVYGIELDPDVVKIASDHFSFPHSDPRMNVKCMDALDFLADTAKSEKEEDKIDVLFVDVAFNMDSALQCPPPSFLTPEVFDNMKNSLSKNGMVSLNLVTRDDDKAKKVRTDICKHFPYVCSVSALEDVNEVIIAQNQVPAKEQTAAKLVNQLRKDLPNYDRIVRAINRIHKV